MQTEPACQIHKAKVGSEGVTGSDPEREAEAEENSEKRKRERKEPLAFLTPRAFKLTESNKLHRRILMSSEKSHRCTNPYVRFH